MQCTPVDILRQYWGYDSFRPLQEDIVNSILAGNDTLALLPTGGGKSICFQVPALCMEGLCIVVTPLVALMIDQAENLRKRGITAAEIHSGMTTREIRLVYEKCMEGRLKFLYLSPERLDAVSFREIAIHLKPCLIAVDEAHCISQWGYDFRPPYLRIADIRELYPEVPVLALTATAVKKVVDDIQLKLNFKKQNVFRKSFLRSNLAYLVYKEEDKLGKLLKICRGAGGTGIVYVRNRKLTRETAEYLNHNGIKANYYHAGLDSRIRMERQKEWMEGRCRVMVATNAFGMGIDKPDVRFVVHLDLPDNLEAYFQEAGRAGRDEKKAWAVILFNEGDLMDARHFLELSWPEPKIIRQVYQAIGNYFQLATGSGKDLSFKFDLEQFSTAYNLKPITVFSVLRILERDGYLAYPDSLNTPSKCIFLTGKEELYKFQVEHREADRLIKALLRSYSGMFSDFVTINEFELARRVQSDSEWVKIQLEYLHKAGIAEYIPATDSPRIIFTTERMDPGDLQLSKTFYYERKADAAGKLDELISYVIMEDGCRSRRLLEYFGDTSASKCGVCDLCLRKKNERISTADFDEISKRINKVLLDQPMEVTKLAGIIGDFPEKKILQVIRWMQDGNMLDLEDGVLTWKEIQK